MVDQEPAIAHRTDQSDDLLRRARRRVRARRQCMLDQSLLARMRPLVHREKDVEVTYPFTEPAARPAMSWRCKPR